MDVAPPPLVHVFAFTRTNAINQNFSEPDHNQGDTRMGQKTYTPEWPEITSL